MYSEKFTDKSKDSLEGVDCSPSRHPIGPDHRRANITRELKAQQYFSPYWSLLVLKALCYIIPGHFHTRFYGWNWCSIKIGELWRLQQEEWPNIRLDMHNSVSQKFTTEEDENLVMHGENSPTHVHCFVALRTLIDAIVKAFSWCMSSHVSVFLISLCDEVVTSFETSNVI